MKIDPQLLKFPKYLPNDIESFIHFYPRKFPEIIAYYENIAPKVATDPKAYEEYLKECKATLLKGAEKLRAEVNQGDHSSMEFLVSMDQRINKLFCYRFWPVNYLFADGPLHDFYSNKLKGLIGKVVDVTDEIEDYEAKVAQMERDLLQSDFADEYLRDAIAHIDLATQLLADPQIGPLIKEAKNPDDALWEKVLEIVEKKDNDHRREIDLYLAEWRAVAVRKKSNYPLYNTLTGAIEFYEKNKELQNRQGLLEERIKDYFKIAKQKLNQDDYELFEMSYLQCRNFIKSKDAMADVDRAMLWMWFGLHDELMVIFKKTRKDYVSGFTGHCGMFYSLVWYLPPELKDIVFTADHTPFDLETL